MEDQPAMKFTFGDREIEARPDNTSLFTHAIGSTALHGVEYDNQRFNHMLHIEERDGKKAATLIFQEQFDDKSFHAATEHMLNNNYSCNLNQRTVRPHVIKAYLALKELELQRGISDMENDLDKLLGEGDGEPE